LFVMKAAAAAPTVAALAGLDHLDAQEAVVSNYAMLGQIDFEHPLFAPFAEPRFSDFTKIHFWKYRRLESARLRNGRILARYDKGDPAFIQIAVGKGSLLVFTSGWQPTDSQLALSSKFVPLLYSVLEQSGAIKAQLAQYLVGDAVALVQESASAGQPLAIRKPDGSQVLAKSERFPQTDQPGIYTIMPSQPPLRFAVNLDPAESKTAPMPVEELERLGVPLKQQSLENAKQAERKRQHLLATELENRQKLWRWLILAALAVLLAETWIAGRLTRQMSAPAGA